MLCALFPRLCANATTVGRRDGAAARPGAGAPARPAARARAAAGARRGAAAAGLRRAARGIPGVYLFRDDAGRVLYVGKSVSIRSRARAHFAPSTPPAAWTAHAAVVDYRTTRSELGALVLENRLIKELRPPGNTRLTERDDRLVLHPLPARHPVPDPRGRAATRRPATPSRSARCGAAGSRSSWSSSSTRCSACATAAGALPRREHPSAYGQMGRCLSPCLGDLDPNLYRRRLDEALRLFVDRPDAARAPLLDHVEAPDARAPPRASTTSGPPSLRRRRRRLCR